MIPKYSLETTITGVVLISKNIPKNKLSKLDEQKCLDLIKKLHVSLKMRSQGIVLVKMKTMSLASVGG